MRICVVGPSYPFRGGIAHYTSLLCKALQERHDLKLISFKRLYPGLLFPGKTQIDTSQAPIRSESNPVIDSINPLTWLSACKEIREFRPDKVVVQWWHPFFAPAFSVIARRSSKFSKVIFLCHNVVPHESGGPTRFLTRGALSSGDCFIVHSEEDRRNLLGLLPDVQVAKSRHPTYDVFNTGDWDRDDCRRSLQLDGNVILFFGLVRRYKGLSYLIEAMAKVLAKIDATLLIVGEFYDDKAPYIERIKDLGIDDRVRVIDQYVPNEEVGKYFAAADVVALPYISATQSGIVQIAFGFGKPVITTSVGGLPEVVENGKTGYVVAPENPSALAEAIVRYFEQPRLEDFAANISRVMDEFSWQKMVEVIEGLGEGDRA